MKRAVLVLLFAASCIPEVDTASTQAAKHPQPDLAPSCPTTLDCASTHPGAGWWLGTTDFCGGTLFCNWANFNPPYYTQTFVIAPQGCTNCVPESGGGSACSNFTSSIPRWTCSAN